MKAIDDLNPDVEFKYEATGWDGIFTALESGKIDVIASQCGKNEEREQKYLFPDIPYTETQAAIVFKKDRTDISSDVNSIAGKTIVSATSGAQTNWLENYNKEHPDKAANIMYADGDMSKMLQEVINGRADAHIASIKVTADYVLKEQGLDSELECLPFETGDETTTYMLLRQDESGEKLKKIIDDIDALDWFSAKEEGLGNLYEGLLEKNASETKSGAGQYFTPRPLINMMVKMMNPKVGGTPL